MSTEHYCEEADCDLSTWDEEAHYCFFHQEIRFGFAWPNGTYREKLVEYVNSAHNEQVPFPGDERLELTAWTIPERWSSALKGKITRPIKFQGCEFESADFLQCQQFMYRIELLGCRWPKNREGWQVIAKCEFLDDVVVDLFGRRILVEDCVFHGKTEFLGHHQALIKEPNLRLNRCSFVNPIMASVRTKVDTWLTESRFQSNTFIDGHEKHLWIDGVIFERYITIGVNSNSHLRLSGAFVHGDMLIAGGYAARQRPELLFDGIHQFGGGRIVFENLDLSQFTSENFTFWNSEFHGVRFPRRGGRIRLKDESKLKKGQGEKARVYRERAEQILCGLEESYNNIKQSYDKNFAFRTGNDFHASQLWARWKLERLHWPLYIRWIRWIGSWTTWYQNISNFGQSAGKPLIWIFLVFVIAFTVYAAIGVWIPEQDPIYVHPFPKISLGVRLFRALECAVDNLLFRLGPVNRDFVPTPGSGWTTAGIQAIGRLQGGLLLVCFAFFLLALRRRFKR